VPQARPRRPVHGSNPPAVDMKTTLRFAMFLLLTTGMVAACNQTSPVDIGAPEPGATSANASLGSQNGNSLYHTRVNGEYAHYYGSSWEGGASTWVSLNVSRNGRDASLYYSWERCTHGEEWWEYICDYSYGYGPIPANDFSGNLQTGLVLNTDTRLRPDFVVWGSDGGRISVRWEPDGWSESRSSGSSEFRWMNTISRSNGTSRSASASASGSMLGSSLPDFGWGHMGSSRNVSLGFERRTSP
jgi:hypothetical protein